MNVIIATHKEHDIQNLYLLKQNFHNITFHLITQKSQLNIDFIKKINPKYIFFSHWSFFIPKNIYNNYECIVFHLGNLPFGRGGSPLQNLIIRGIYESKICALRVNEILDGGDIYLRYKVKFSKLKAQTIYEKISKIIYTKMIPIILTSNICPKKQKGKAVIFKRRTPQESDINTLKNIDITKIYDFIRMLDAKDYPKAFLQIQNIKIEFSNAKLKNNTIQAKVEIYEK
ncbi:methionyl-tRNA formyltransferase [Campylobacter volucris]|uniref:methionyl-tRNA formyltransferase n=2 Tax=Campylobacter volucris TaxID=1031542 RepID=UPI00189C95E8|nr:methionyl-tRNA formyltransferase [Campylobacter volucris]MBF7066976.1 methionyl-tRNA formyltransferase [Campylobacter volucris]